MKGLLFTYLVAYGGAAAALSRPFVGLLAYTCFAIVRPESMWPWAVPPGNYSRVVAVGMLLGWAKEGCGDWRFGRGRGIVAALVAFLAWAALGAARADRQEIAWTFVDDLMKIGVPCLVGVTLVDSVEKLRQLAWTIVLSEGYVAFEFNSSYFQGYNRVREEGFATMDNNSVAIMLVACTGFAFVLGLETRRWWRRGLAFGCSALLAHAVLLTNSRGGMLSLIITGAVILLLTARNPRNVAIFAVAIAVAIRMAGPEVIDRFSTVFASEEERDFSAKSRLDLWGNCVDIMIDRPLFGVGPDHWPLVAHEYGWPEGKEAHTLWLQIGAELGVPGLIFLGTFYGLCFVQLLPLAAGRRATADPRLGTLARMTIASLSGFVVSAQFVSLEKLEIPYIVAIIGAGVLKLESTAATAAAARNRGPYEPFAGGLRGGAVGGALQP